MTAEERLALRKKHQHLDVGTDDCGYVASLVECDVLRLLNALEEAEREVAALRAAH